MKWDDRPRAPRSTVETMLVVLSVLAGYGFIIVALIHAYGL